MVLPSLPGGLIVLRALTLPRNSPGLPDLCPLHRTTGLWCPLCGGTRATRELMHGDLWAAMGYNPFALVLEAAVGAGIFFDSLLNLFEGYAFRVNA